MNASPTLAAARAWATGWAKAWATHDAPAVARLYAPNARFISHPFRSGQSPLDYARSAFAEEDELITILRFNAQGLAVEHLDYWAMTEGRHEVPQTNR